ncbi:sulfatase-like hydrolase/transferase [Phascolarctobacterium sp.]|uniref:sulfatase-like hydrolase/transferase n=1 Tax=Phascolarctobacterium sp. TaxID=2049039 RepID=UPI0038633C91
MNFIKKHFMFIVTFVVSYVIISGCYYFTSEGIASYTIGLQMRRYIPCALAVALAVELWKKSGLRLSKLLPHAVASVLWIVVYPACYWLAYNGNTAFIDKHYDQAFGAYVFAFTVCLRLVVAWTKMDGKVAVWLFGLLHTLIVVIPVTQLAYFANYKTPITEAASMALLQTNANEAREFLLLNLGYSGIVAVVMFLGLVWYCFSCLNSLQSSGSGLCYTRKMLVGALVIIVATAGYGQKMFWKTGVMETYVFAKDYFDRANKFKEIHDQKFNKLVVVPKQPNFSQPSTIIMVIGESASRYYMSAYNPNNPNDNSPWLRSMKQDKNFVVFNHAYTSWGQTVPSLERALTERNQYNGLDFNESLTIIDIAKKAGYNTYWFSNQGSISDADTPITLVAKTADSSAWICDSVANTKGYKYDSELLDYLKQVDPTKNNFVVLHFMGSHEDCINRYPANFTKFGKAGEFDTVLNYDNSIAYTDTILKEIHEYASANLNLQAMLYFSDHGGDPYRKRHPDQTGFKGLRIPMFVFMSDEYQKLYPEASKTIKAHKNYYFTNDLIYEAVCGLLQVKSSNYDESMGLFSDKYKFTRDTLTTNLGKNKLSDDKDENQNEE